MKNKFNLTIAITAVLLLTGCTSEPKVYENSIASVTTASIAVITTITTEATTTSATATTSATTTITTEAETTTTSVTTTTEAEITTMEAETTLPTATAEAEITTPLTSAEPKTTTAVDDSLSAIEGLQTTVGSTSVYYKSSLSDKAWDFINECVFVGDSICSGLKAYEILSAKNVLAVGNTAARNIFEDWVSFKVNGMDMDLISALATKQPKYVVFSMGMNDVNMTTEAQFCANYDNIFKKAREVLPDSTFYVFSITPITYKDNGKIFTYNTTIDSFNAALKSHLKEAGTATFIDVAPEMKNSKNLLRADYLGSPDGVHLAPAAYYAMLYQFIDQVF